MSPNCTSPQHCQTNPCAGGCCPPINPNPPGSLERLAARNVAMRGFLLRMLDPEDLGHAVTREVRDGARQLLGLQPAGGG